MHDENCRKATEEEIRKAIGDAIKCLKKGRYYEIQNCDGSEREKNAEFRRKYNVNKNFVYDVIKSLKFTDYDHDETAYNEEIKGCTLHIFVCKNVRIYDPRWCEEETIDASPGDYEPVGRDGADDIDDAMAFCDEFGIDPLYELDIYVKFCIKVLPDGDMLCVVSFHEAHGN